MKTVPMGSALAIALLALAATASAGGRECRALADRAQLGVGIAAAPEGVRIERVEKGGAAEAAGLQAGDLVLEIDGTKVSEPSALAHAIRSHRPGDDVRLRVQRDGREMDVTAKVQAWKPGFGHGFGPGFGSGRFPFGTPPPVRLGINLQPLTDGLRAFFKVSAGRGTLVSDVVGGSPAEKAGVRPGDVVVSVNGKDVDDSGDLIDALRELKGGDRVTLGIVREGGSLSLDVLAEERPAAERHGSFRMPHGAFEFKLDPEAAGSLEALGPALERSLEQLGPAIEKRMETLGPELQKRLEEIGPEIKDRLRHVHRVFVPQTI